jgi:hypothetical protein
VKKKNKQKKLKRIIHQFKVSTYAKVRAEKQSESVKRPDDNINFISATFQDVKQGELSHELNRMRRLAIKLSLNKYEHPASNHEKLEPYQRTSDWLDWIGIVSDISMPTGKNGMLDGKILIDKFSFENNKGQKELLDYHIWLPVNEIRFLLNTQSQIVGVGDTIRGKSRVLQYSSKGGHGIKFGLGATLIKDVGIYISFKKVGSEHISIGQQLESKYDRFDDWILKLSNDGIPQKTIQEYKENNDINMFAQKTSGHVSAIYQPSKYVHYFDRLSPLEVRDKEDVRTQIYTAKVKDFDVKKYDGQTMPIIHLVNITNEYNRLVNTGGWYQYDMSLAKLGILKQKDKIEFTATPQFFKNHTEKQTLKDPVLLTNRKVEKLPDNKTLLFGWIMAQKKIPKPSETVQDWINEYEFWAKSNKKSSEIGGSLSINSLASQANTNIEAVKMFINKKNIKPLFESNEKKYYSADKLDELIVYLKDSNEKVKNVLLEVKQNQQKMQLKKVNDKNSLSEKTIPSKSKPKVKEPVANKDKEGKTTNGPKIIQRGFCLHINTSKGTFTSYEFKGIGEAYNVISKLGRKEDHNEFVQVYDSEYKLRFVSVKDIKSFG